MLVKISGATPVGIEAVPVTIEVHAVQGFDFTLVGLPDSAVKESHERILAALQENGYEYPKRRFTINMAPADIRKEGASYDLPLAIGILAGVEQVRTDRLGEFMIMGELSLDGSLQAIRGVLPMALCAREKGFKGIILPQQNAEEAAVVKGLEVYGMRDIKEVVEFLNWTPSDSPCLGGEKQSDETPSLSREGWGGSPFKPVQVDTDAVIQNYAFSNTLDFADVRGQEAAKRAMEVAAAGGHNMIMVGAPGAGKSMMAKRMPTILPPLSLEESLETTKIHSVAGLMSRRKMSARTESLIVTRPFRAPHHTITDVGLVGGGNNPQPGEISLAHNGVLFLDEMPEFSKRVLDSLRQPLEDREITIARNRVCITYPASVMMVAAMNPCPCGYLGVDGGAHECKCLPWQIARYQSHISGPMMDRIDIQCFVDTVKYEDLRRLQPGESSATIRERVVQARKRQEQRFAAYNRKQAGETNPQPVHCNAQMTSRMIRQYCALDEQGEKILKQAFTVLKISARAHDRILKVARTIADLAGSQDIQSDHIYEAIHMRTKEKAGV